MASMCFYCGQNTHPSLECPAKNYDKSGRLREKQLKKLGYLPEDKFLFGLQDKNLYSQGTWLAYFFRPRHLEDIILQEAQKQKSAGSRDVYSDPELIEIEQLRKLGKSKLAEGHPAEAAAILELAAQKKPGDYRILLSAGYAQVENDKAELALQYFKSAEAAFSLDSHGYLPVLLQARVYQCMGDLPKAVELAGHAADRYPHSPEVLFFLAELYARQNRHQEALAQLEAAGRLNCDFRFAPAWEPDFDPFKDEWLEKIKGYMASARRDAELSLQNAKECIGKAGEEAVEVCNLADFGPAKAKYELAKIKYETHSYYGYLDAKSLADETPDCLYQAKGIALARQRLAVKQAKEFVKLRLKAGLAGAFAAAGWGLVVGGCLGMLRAVIQGQAYNWAIPKYAIKGTLLGFLAVYIYNLRTTIIQKRSFMRSFAKQFKKRGAK